MGELFVHDSLGCAQYTLVLAIGVYDPLRRALGLHEKRTHQLPGVVDQAHELLAIGLQVGNGTLGNARGCSGFGYGRSNLDDKAWIEWLGNNVVGTEAEVFACIRYGYFIVLLD